MFTLRFKTDNAAFREDSGEATGDAMAYEISLALKAVSKAVQKAMLNKVVKCNGVIRDSNGASIGNWSFEP